MDNIVELKTKVAATNDNGASAEADERAVILSTLENVITFHECLEEGMKLMTQAFTGMQRQIRDLEHEVAELKKKKKPAIYSATGERAN